MEESPREQTPPSFSSAALMAFGSNVNSVAVGWPDGKVEFWIAQPFRRVRAIADSTNAPMHLALAESGQQLSVHRADDTVEIWNLQTGELVRRLPALERLFLGPNCEFWAHDRILARATYGSSSLAELWLLPKGERRVFVHPKGNLWNVAVSHDGRLLATSAQDGVLRLWDVASEREIAAIPGQLKKYYSLAFSPDDSRLAGGGDDGTITMWDVSTLQQVAHWKAHQRSAWVRFVGGDQVLATFGDPNEADRYQSEVRIWRAPPLAEIDAAAKAGK